ncbi:universal stress protein [Phycicoccus endophyticus]|uniref:Universal stress protein n=1 Tax=Phycicoccus endophyticus TaxID=1690220 RepID=A0A7G9R557_9MICO|nr:universal stress protein [Phycicoccus endophyticus]NHI20666.1 universal stress protein [Phycicoccus endophyticus]QNN50732.1 universal stress protein [Phycicoccus endophyticus]GGL43580.1 universal stress protein [Phycicoccus endophyticus]
MTIVVGFVPTKEGRAALTRAVEEAKSRGSRLVVINSHRGGIDDETMRAAEDELRQATAEVEASGAQVEVRQLVRGNEPAEDLIAVASETDADLIVIGLRRRTPVGKLILGSNAQRILLDAPCAVLAVKG